LDWENQCLIKGASGTIVSNVCYNIAFYFVDVMWLLEGGGGGGGREEGREEK